MELSKIRNYGRQIPCFLGVFQAEDLLKLNITKNEIGFIVVEKEHAIGIYITKTTIDVMDPLGPENADIFSPICTFLAEHLPCKTLNMCSKIQADESQKCAKFCLLYLYLHCLGYSFTTIINYFSCDYMKNDDKVDALFDSFFE